MKQFEFITSAYIHNTYSVNFVFIGHQAPSPPLAAPSFKIISTPESNT